MSARLLLLGATGAVGREVLALALADPRVGAVVAPVRRALPPAAKLEAPVIDFAAPAPDAACWRADVAVCALGTTRRDAGSAAAFVAIDRDLVLTLARLARQGGVRHFAYNSSLGADPAARGLYLRSKGETEAGLRALAFPGLTLVRPSLIDATRDRPRPGEQVGLFVGGLLRPLLPRRWRPVTARAIAVALLEAALAERPGERLLLSEELGGGG